MVLCFIFHWPLALARKKNVLVCLNYGKGNYKKWGKIKTGKLQDNPSFWQEFLYYSMCSLCVSCASLSEVPGKSPCWILCIPLGKLVTALGFIAKLGHYKIIPFVLMIFHRCVCSRNMWAAVHVMCFIITVVGFMCVCLFFWREGHAKQTSESACAVSWWQVFLSVEATLRSRLQGSTQQIPGSPPGVWREQPKDELRSAAARATKPGSKETRWARLLWYHLCELMPDCPWSSPHQFVLWFHLPYLRRLLSRQKVISLLLLPVAARWS